MIQVIILGCFSVLFAYLASYARYHYLLKFCFFLVFIFLALRYNYGNDYDDYQNIFEEVNNRPNANLFNGSIYGEIGWLFLNRLFKYANFFYLVAVLALFNCIVYYRFIKQFVRPRSYWLAVFIYIFNPGFMLVHLSAMRQSLAIGIFLLSLNLILKRKMIPYFLMIILASFFHASVLVVLPVYFLTFWKPQFNSARIIYILLGFLALFLFGQALTPLLSQLISEYFDKYSRLLNANAAVIGSGLGILFNMALLALVLFYSKYYPKNFFILITLVLCSFLFIPLSLMFEMFTRMALYFLPFIIVIYPMIFSYIKNSLFRNISVVLFILYTLYQFNVFYNSEVYSRSYETYQTIIPFL